MAVDSNTRTYIHAIVFSWDPDTEKPFDLYPRDALAEVPETWFSGKFGYVERKKILSLPSINEEDKNFSIFCKIERGKELINLAS